MRLLHLSDLHVTWSDESIDSLWASVRRAVGDDVLFDAILLSGDLTQSATEADYKDLTSLIQIQLLKVLRDGDPSRIIAVPGNHDVDWQAKIGEFRSVFEIGPDKVPTTFKAALQNDDSYRLAHSGFGHFEIFEIKNPHEQFRNVQLAFLDVLYGLKPGPTSHLVKEMNLLQEGEDWSAHIFPSEEIAIFGFNSCHKNDRFWHGARINPASITRAEEFARSRARGFLWCAVWHHGISSVGHRPDYLPLSDISRLANAGFRVGFHGHTHESMTQVFKGRFTNDITLVATGSLGAGATDRPDAVGNQFSTVFLSKTEMHGTIFERRPPHDFEAKQRHHERLRDLVPRVTTDQHITTHRRSYITDTEGSTRVSIELTREASSFGEATLTIAHLRAPICAPRCDSPEVAQRNLGNGEIRYDVLLRHIRTDKSTFRYRASNMLALSQIDLQRRSSTSSSPRDPLWEERLHHVRFPCQELVLEFELPTGILDNVEPAVTWLDELGDSHKIEEEASRCEVIRQPDRSRVTLTFPTPQVGLRYGLRYMPPAGPTDGDIGKLESFCRRLVKIGRQQPVNERFREIPVVQLINTTMIPALADHLGFESDQLAWMLMIWNPGIQRLVPVFGQFEAAKWGLRFEHGSGVAGHALRFRSIARWHKDRASDSLVYLDVPPGQEIRDRHVWLLCIPILLSRTGSGVGVLTLESNEDSVPSLDRLENFARSEQDDFETSHQLLYTSNISFWKSCLEASIGDSSPAFSSSDRTLVESAVSSWTDAGLGADEG